MVGIRYIYGLIYLLLLSIQASSIPEVTYEYMPMEIIDYVFNHHFNDVDRLNFYATSCTLYNRYKATVRQALMQPSSQGYKLSISKIYKAWKSEPHHSDLKSLLRTHKQVKHFGKYIFNGPIEEFQSSQPKNTHTAMLIKTKAHNDIICILIDMYPDAMLSRWSWLSFGWKLVITENPSPPLLQAILKRFPLPIQELDTLDSSDWGNEYIANPETFEMVIRNSRFTGKWNRPYINKLLYYVCVNFRCREPLELLLDLSPPDSFQIYQNRLIDFIMLGVHVRKVARCCYEFQYNPNSTIEISQLLIWGAEDEVFVKNVLIPYFGCCTTPDWSQKHAELAKELGYSEQFIEYANKNFTPKNLLSVLFCGHLLGYTFQKNPASIKM